MAKIPKFNVTVKYPEEPFIQAVKLLQKFRNINKIKLDFEIVIDCSEEMKDQFGGFTYGEQKIYLNLDKIYRGDGRISAFGYFEDYTVMGVIVHEFCHMFNDHVHILKEYKEEFQEKIILNYHSASNRDEEMTELLTLYMTNPYLLQLVEPDVFEFFKDRWRSPTPCTKRHFDKITSKWDDRTKKHCLSTWKIEI